MRGLAPKVPYFQVQKEVNIEENKKQVYSRVHLVLLNAHLYVGINPDVRSMMRQRKAL